MSLGYTSGSILGGNVTSYTTDQLEVRKKILEKREGRENQELMYLNSKTGWCRMISSVDTQSPNNPSSYASFLASRNILTGGILDASNSTVSYGGGYSAYSEFGQTSFGERPRGGITDFTVEAQGTFGTLRRATINFKANSPEELTIFEELYMRPGASILLEWGHSLYYDNEGTFVTTPISYLTKYRSQDDGFRNQDGFFTKTDQDRIYSNIKELREETSGNYDAMYGFISNFVWKFNLDGTYDCQVTVMSRGELIESLEMLIYPKTEETGSTSYSVASAFRSELEPWMYLSSESDPEFIGPVQPTSSYIPEINNPYEIKSFLLKDDKANEEGVESITDKYYVISLRSILNICNKLHILYYKQESQKTDSKPLFEFFVNTNGDAIKTPYTTFDEHFGLDPKVVVLAKNGTKLGYKVGQFEDLIPTSYRTNDILDIFVGVDHVLSIAENTNTNSDLLTFIRTLLGSIQTELGNINDFDVHYEEEDKLFYIVDRNVVPDKIDSKIDLIGLPSEIENISLTSKITPSISTMVAISTGVTNSSAGEELLQMQRWNTGIKDRHTEVLEYGVDIKSTVTSALDKKLAQNKQEIAQAAVRNDREVVDKLQQERLILEEEKRQSTLTDKEKLVEHCANMNEYGDEQGSKGLNYLPTGISNLRAIHRKVMEEFVKYYHSGDGNNGIEAQNAPGLIPFELSFTIAGIGGFKIGQGLKLSESSEKILPERYRGNVGFLVTGVSHAIKSNRWVTDIKTQMVLLDKYFESLTF